RSIAGRRGGWPRRKRIASASRSGSSRRASRWLVATCWVHRWSGSRRRCGKASTRGTADTAPLPHPFLNGGTAAVGGSLTIEREPVARELGRAIGNGGEGDRCSSEHRVQGAPRLLPPHLGQQSAAWGG